MCSRARFQTGVALACARGKCRGQAALLIIARSISTNHVGFRGVFFTAFGFMQFQSLFFGLCAFLLMSFLYRRKCIARKAQDISGDQEYV